MGKKPSERSAVRPQSESRRKTDRADCIRSILASRDLTIFHVSNNTKDLYGPSSPYFVPHNLYYDLGSETFSPSIYQLCALSRISGYRLYDWMRVFGFCPEDIPRLQALLPATGTILLDSSVDDPQAWVPWFRNRAEISAVPAIAPLSQLLELTQPRRIRSLSDVDNRTFLYAKVGQRDAFAFPELLPGSIVRIDPILSREIFSLAPGNVSDQIFLIEHGGGLSCSRFRRSGDNRMVLVSTQLPHHQRIELRLPAEGTVRGVVDLEIRPLTAVDHPLPLGQATSWHPRAFVSSATLGHLLRRARRNMALSFREASVLSRRIAHLLGERRYFISASSLSDYEVSELCPRHIHKMITLCVLYGVPLATFLRTVGVAFEGTGQDPIPDQLLPRLGRSGIDERKGDVTEAEGEHRGFLDDLIDRFGEIPLFLRGSLSSLSGLATPSLHDFFWVGKPGTAAHAYFVNTLLLVVNRRKKKPHCDLSQPSWRQSLYLLIKRDGTYLVGACGLENGIVVMYPDAYVESSRTLSYPQDVEVVGQIVTLVRKR